MITTPQPPPGIDRLPEELLLQIFTFLDATPPSETQLRREPSLDLLIGQDPPLKRTSLVSQRWRRVALPLLFRHSRFRLDGPIAEEWGACVLCCRALAPPAERGVGIQSTGNDVDYYHEEICRYAQQCIEERSASPVRDLISRWLPRFYHGLEDFLLFLHTHALVSKVQSFVLTNAEGLPDVAGRTPGDWRQLFAAAFWHRCLSVLVDVRTIVIIAAPTDLACLTNCAIDTSGTWAFKDMTNHILTLQTSSPTPRIHRPALTALRPHSTRYPGIASSSLLNLHPWSQITLNESAFLSAYGTYEYFERGPPSLIYSLKDCLSPRPTYNASMRRVSSTPLASLRKFTYTAIFPFATHLDFRELLPQLEELDLQLAPLQEEGILNDPARVGKAELADCWEELGSVYRKLVSQIATYRISERSMPFLKRFVCRDVVRELLREELDEIFIPLCLPVWAEMERGVFARIRGSADGDGMASDW
ncbi:hypothetical protein LTR62_002682 [Meristemomyces frigidus]|uniref:F-box domain-containing protein n=1 Tax=Meristemomyces frigidus TaxID=1508187 RepID=A0AAN7YHE8_9PEZI|nr:hypothetical protein LTR62_002682 [Meristemomyces frigidus]